MGSILLAAWILLMPVLALAASVPANPAAPPGIGVVRTATPAPTEAQNEEPTEAPTETPTETPTEAPTEAPTETPTEVPTETPTEAPTEEPVNAEEAVPAVPVSEYEADDLLPEEIVEQLDAEVRDYLTGDGELIDTVDGIRNILLVGVDARPGETKSRSDTMLILTLDGNRNQIRLTSLMRDMYVSLPGRGNNRINAAWVYGGPELLLAAIEENFGLTIEEYVAVDLRVLIDVIDELGGLTLTVETKQQLNAINGVIDAYNYQFGEKTNDGLLTELGEQLMNGKQVQAYARFRKIDSDVQRTARQREVLTKLFDKLQEKSIIQLTKIAAMALDRVETNLSLSDMVALMPVMYRMKDAEITQLNIPYDASYQSKTISGMSVLVPNLDACRERLSSFVNGTDSTGE